MKKIKKNIVSLGIAILCGLFVGKVVFQIYHDNLYQVLKSSKLYLLLQGEYDSLALLRENNLDGDILYYNDSGKYERVVGITNRIENVSKIEKLYDDKLMVMEYYISGKISDRQKEYDELLIQSKDNDEVRKIVDNILKIYQDSEGVILIAG